MYTTLLFLHSILRWVLFIVLLYTIIRSYIGWFGKLNFRKLDSQTRFFTLIVAHFQLIIGVLLLFISPIVRLLIANFSESIKNIDIRFAAMEHTFLMLIGIAFITIGASVSKRKSTDQAKFKTIAIWYTIAFIIIVMAIPWQLSPFGIERPLLRGL